MTIQEKLVNRGWAKSRVEANEKIQIFMEEIGSKLIEDGYIQLGGYLNMKTKVKKGGGFVTLPNKKKVQKKDKMTVKITAGKRLLDKVSL